MPLVIDGSHGAEGSRPIRRPTFVGLPWGPRTPVEQDLRIDLQVSWAQAALSSALPRVLVLIARYVLHQPRRTRSSCTVTLLPIVPTASPRTARHRVAGGLATVACASQRQRPRDPGVVCGMRVPVCSARYRGRPPAATAAASRPGGSLKGRRETSHGCPTRPEEPSSAADANEAGEIEVKDGRGWSVRGRLSDDSPGHLT